MTGAIGAGAAAGGNPPRRLEAPGKRYGEKLIQGLLALCAILSVLTTTAIVFSLISPTIGFFEIVRRLFLIRTVRRILMSYAVVGVLLIPYQTFLFFFLEEKWNLSIAQRGLFSTAGAAVPGATPGSPSPTAPSSPRRTSTAVPPSPAPWRAARGAVRLAEDIHALAERARSDSDPIEEARDRLDQHRERGEVHVAVDVRTGRRRHWT